ncbi:MAG: SIMPL domain-containing protein [Clostridiales bacterium]|nr:SIMPL domain-containing protein [Clostridiales bacterium]
MKKLICLALALALMLSLALPALADKDVEDMSKLVITGNAVISLEADTATLEVGAQTRGKTVAEANQDNIKIIDAIILEVEKLGIEKKYITTSNYNVYFEQDYSVVGTAQSLINGSFVVNNMLRIKINDITKVSAVIDAASAAGANNIHGLSFQSSKYEESYLEALKEAVLDAKTKAEVLALVNGMSLGRVLKVESLDTNSYNYAMNYVGTMAKEAMDTTILSGNVLVNATVTLTYELK